MTAAFRPGLGHIQRGALTRLARSPKGLTSADLADLPAGAKFRDRRTAAGHALKQLGLRGLVRMKGRVPALSDSGRGAPAQLWVITSKGRRLLAKGGWTG